MTQTASSPRRPGRAVVAGFVAIIAVGTVLLTLPIAHEPGLDDPPGLSDALFTAASAATVTGLSTVNVGPTWSVFGELVILVLIQLGGLGLMTAASIVAVVLSQNLGLRQRGLAGTEIGVGHFGEIRPLVKAVATFSAGAEIVTAVLLLLAFADDGHSIVGAAYLAVFHSVSAFNNAGFALFEGGMERFATDWLVSLSIAGSFIAGGLGFPVVAELSRRRPAAQWSLFTKLTLTASVGLLAVGTIVVAVLEWANPATLGPHALPDKLLISFFQSATTRTAGFATVPISDLREATLLLFILLMVIGANSASTGGGIKTSTFAVAIWSTVAELRGSEESVNLFEREVPQSQQRQALALVIVALGTVGTSTFLLAATTDLPLDAMLFEAASAFGTVGLSLGITAELSIPSQFIIIVLMFLGRVGPMTLGAALLLRTSSRRFRYPEEKLLVG